MKPTYDLLLDGTRALVASHDVAEKSKLGVLRAGNTGVVLPDGRIAGKCARQSLLRLQGVDADSVNHSRQLMFAAGHANEQDWVERLVAAGIPEACIRREEQVPISWTLPSGRRVTGRPDMVLLEPPGPNGATWAPVRGLELKQVSSLWTGRSVVVKSEPKAMHLMQAGHYSWRLGIPFELWYTSRADFQLPMMRNVQWPERGRAGSEFFEYKPDGYPLKMIPFVVGFELGWTDAGELRYRRLSAEGPGVWVTSVISKQGIEKYFRTVDEAAATDRLPPAPVNIGPTGEPGNYSICSYCPLQSVCDSYKGQSVQEWQSRVQALVPKLAPTGSMQ